MGLYPYQVPADYIRWGKVIKSPYMDLIPSFSTDKGKSCFLLDGKSSITWASLYYKYFFQKYLFFYNVVVYPNIYIVFGAIVEDGNIFLCVFRVYVVDCGYLLK